MTRDEMLALAERVERVEREDNSLDVHVEIALFEPIGKVVGLKANNAGSKVIELYDDGSQHTFWALSWTSAPVMTAKKLRARAAQLSQEGEG